MIRILAIADIHLEFDRALEIVKSERDIDYIFIAGDIADIPFTEYALDEIISFLNNLERIANAEIYAVLGNNDHPELFNMDFNKIKILKEDVVTLKNNLKLIGISGTYHASEIYNLIPLSEQEIYEKLTKLSRGIDGKELIILIHEPPSPTKLSFSAINKHAGSRMLHKFIEEKQPLLCICGHVHEAFGIDRIGKSLILNVGPAYEGRYSIIEIDQEVKIMLKKMDFK